MSPVDIGLKADAIMGGRLKDPVSKESLGKARLCTSQSQVSGVHASLMLQD